MIALSLAEVASITGGELHGASSEQAQEMMITSDIVTDSREATPHSLYVARIGESLDGHDFASDAAKRGAVAVLGSRAVPELPTVVVDDVQQAFADLARAVVDRAPAVTVVGITGSSGKTTTKDLLGSVLGVAGPTIAPVGSYNSEVGVPLTVTRVTDETRFLIVEMGARGVGHIDYLTRIAPPQVGVVLNVGSAHVGEFGSREAIAQAKGELVQALPESGVAVLNADDDAVRAMAGRTQARVVLVGEAADADYRATDITVGDDGRASFTAITPMGEVQIALQVVGRHQVGNALAVLAVASECGIPHTAAATALGAAQIASRWRMEVTTRDDGVTIINDAYNANPESMRAAVEALVTMARGRRTWAILGAMLELGAESDADHAAIGRLVQQRGVDELLVVGEGARAMATIEPQPSTRIRWTPDADAAADILSQELTKGDLALFKSSRDVGLRWLADALTASQSEANSQREAISRSGATGEDNS